MIILANILIFIAQRTAKYYLWGHSECGLFNTVMPRFQTLGHYHTSIWALMQENLSSGFPTK